MKEAKASRHRLLLVDWLIAVGLAASVVYLSWQNLAPSSLWLDDAWQALVLKARTLREVMLVSVTAPGYTLALKGWFALVGFSELKAQLPSLLFAAILPGATFLLARRRSIHRWAALFGGALLLSSPVLASYSTRVKQFSLDAVLALILISVAWKIIETDGTTGRWIVLLIATIGGTIVSGAVAPVAGGALLVATVAVWSRSPDQRKMGLRALAGFCLFSAVWWLVFLQHAVNSPLRDYWNAYYIDTRSVGAAAATTTEAVLRMAGGFAGLPIWLVAPGLFLAAVTVATRSRVKALLLLAPVIIALALAAMHMSPLGTGRTDAYLFPGLALLVALALDTSGNDSARRNLIPALGVLVVLSLALASHPQEYRREDVRPLVEILDQLPSQTQVVVYPNTQFAYALYTRRNVSFLESESSSTGFEVEIDGPMVTVLGGHRAEPDLYRREIEALATDRRTVWFLASHFWPDLRSIEDQFGELGFGVGAKWERPGAELIRYERPS